MTAPRPQKLRADSSLCGWGSCQSHTDGDPLCQDHMRKAWAIVQSRLTAEQRYALEHAADIE